MQRVVISLISLVSLGLVVSAYFTMRDLPSSGGEKSLETQRVQSQKSVVLNESKLDEIRTLRSANSKEDAASENSQSKSTSYAQDQKESFEKSSDRLSGKQLQLQSKLLDEKIKRLRRVQDEVDGDLSNLRKKRAQKIEKLVKSVEEMRSESAAEFMEVLSQDLAIAILERLSIEQSSKIMNLMSKDKLAQLAEAFVGIKPSRDVANDNKEDAQ